jgi:hypothetical protein
MPRKSLADQAAAMAARAHGLSEPLVVDRQEARDPTSGEPVYRFSVVSAANANGPAHQIVVNARGRAVPSTPELAAQFEHTVLATGAISGPVGSAIVISPDTNVLTLNPGDTIDETITVTIPKNAGPARADVYFLADTTSSMSNILNAVQTGANNVLTALNGLGVDMAFGVGNYKDFLSGDPFCFQHQVSPTNALAAVTAGINAWSATGGTDIPEGALFALDSLAVAPGGTIGWRSGSKCLIVWFGDAPGHDPICPAASGAPAAITEVSATKKLVTEQITVLAISTNTPGLDDDPKLGATDYTALCGPPGGLPGQGTRIAAATGGAFAQGINAANIVNTIISLVKGAVGAIQSVTLVPSASVAPFVSSITPAAGYGPLAGDQDHVLTFDVTFTGRPCTSEAQVITGTLDVVADGTVVASKRAQITTPACSIVYSVKFLCGEQTDCDCACAPVQPGRYATAISIHNSSLKPVDVVKRFVPLVLAGAATGREPRVAGVRAEDRITLPPGTATMDDCCRIAELLFGGEPASPVPITIGFLELTASAEIAVTATYTTSGHQSGGVSIAVEQIAGRRH